MCMTWLILSTLDTLLDGLHQQKTDYTFKFELISNCLSENANRKRFLEAKTRNDDDDNGSMWQSSVASSTHPPIINRILISFSPNRNENVFFPRGKAWQGNLYVYGVCSSRPEMIQTLSRRATCRAYTSAVIVDRGEDKRATCVWQQSSWIHGWQGRISFILISLPLSLLLSLKFHSFFVRLDIHRWPAAEKFKLKLPSKLNIPKLSPRRCWTAYVEE